MTLSLYHRTTEENARTISESGFCDHTGTYLTDQEFTGVWLSDQPLDINEGAKGETLLRVTLDASEKDLEPYEWIEEDKPYREWLVPSALINACIVVAIIDEEDLKSVENHKAGRPPKDATATKASKKKGSKR